MFRGHEDDVFKGAQPNLFCNHFYWVDTPEARWPDKISQCQPSDAPYMYCSDSFYCNWTNNPQLWSIAWWRKEWIDGTLKKPNSISPYADVEYWCARRAARWQRCRRRRCPARVPHPMPLPPTRLSLPRRAPQDKLGLRRVE